MSVMLLQVYMYALKSTAFCTSLYLLFLQRHSMALVVSVENLILVAITLVTPFTIWLTRLLPTLTMTSWG